LQHCWVHFVDRFDPDFTGFYPEDLTAFIVAARFLRHFDLGEIC